MAGDSKQFADDPRLLPEEFRQLILGPYSHAAGAGTILFPGNASVTVAVVDRETTVDKISLICTTKPTAARNIRFGYATAGQTIAAAVSASQWLMTANYDLNGITIDTLTDMTLDRTANRIPAGSRIFMFGGSTADTALVGLMPHLRLKTQLN